MTPAQLQAFKAAILAETDPTLAALRGQGAAAYSDIKYWYNQESSVDVWRPKIDVAELLGAVVWADFVATGISNQNAWFALTQGGWVDATQARVRSGFVTVFGAGSATVSSLSALAQRKATRIEAVFTTAGVCSMFGYSCTYADVKEAMEL